MPGSFGLTPPPALPAIVERQIAVLRLLGRLEVMRSNQIKRLVYPDMSPRGMGKQLITLLGHQLIWRTRVHLEERVNDDHARTPVAPPYVYGLTTAGKALLDTLEIEHDQRSLDGLRAREAGSVVVTPNTIAHDLQASWWCSSLLLEIQRACWCHSIFVQVEFTIHPRQRFDALVILRLNLTTPRPDVGRIPWFDGTPRRPDEVEVRLALEVDRGTEPLPILLQKAVAYRDLTAGGIYHQAFGGPVLPVILAPTSRRAGQIAKEWQSAWPDGWGVISVVRACDHPEHGTLWGDYRAMSDGKPCPLLSALTQDGRGRVRAAPLLTLERWREGMQREVDG